MHTYTRTNWLKEPTALLRYLTRQNVFRLLDPYEFAKGRTAQEFWDDAEYEYLLTGLLRVADVRREGPLPWKHYAEASIAVCELALTYFANDLVPGVETLQLAKKYLVTPTRALGKKIARNAVFLADSDHDHGGKLLLKSTASLHEAIAYASFCTLRSSIQLSHAERRSLSEVEQFKLNELLGKSYALLPIERRSTLICHEPAFNLPIQLMSEVFGFCNDAFDDRSAILFESKACQIIRDLIPCPWHEDRDQEEFEKHNRFVKHLEFIDVKKSTIEKLTRTIPVVTWNQDESLAQFLEWSVRSLWYQDSDLCKSKLNEAFEGSLNFFKKISICLTNAFPFADTSLKAFRKQNQLNLCWRVRPRSKR